MPSRLKKAIIVSLVCLTISSKGAFAQTWFQEDPDSSQKSRHVEPAVPEAAPQQPPASSRPAAPEEPGPTEPSAPTKPDQDKADAALELARKAQNPISSMVSVPFQYNGNFGVGSNDASTHALTIQPVVPVAGKEWNLVNRAIIPISYVPNSAISPASVGGAELGLGDINYSLFFVPAEPGKLIWGVGPSVTLPTATGDKLGTGKWLAGPTAVALTIQGPWVVGGLVSQQWSVAGNSARPDVSLSTIQPFLTYNMKDGWFVTSSPIITAN